MQKLVLASFSMVLLSAALAITNDAYIDSSADQMATYEVQVQDRILASSVE